MVGMPVNTTKILAEFATTAKLNDLLTKLITPVIADCFGCIIAGSNSQVAIRSYKSFKKFGICSGYKKLKPFKSFIKLSKIRNFSRFTKIDEMAGKGVQNLWECILGPGETFFVGFQSHQTREDAHIPITADGIFCIYSFFHTYAWVSKWCSFSIYSLVEPI